VGQHLLGSLPVPIHHHSPVRILCRERVCGASGPACAGRNAVAIARPSAEGVIGGGGIWLSHHSTPWPHCVRADVVSVAYGRPFSLSASPPAARRRRCCRRVPEPRPPLPRLPQPPPPCRPPPGSPWINRPLQPRICAWRWPWPVSTPQTDPRCQRRPCLRRFRPGAWWCPLPRVAAPPPALSQQTKATRPPPH
jgi:hypothetical protein